MKSRALLVVMGLSVFSMLGFVSGAGGTELQKATGTYFVSFTGSWTATKEALLRKDGGTVMQAFPELSVILAQSVDPSFSIKLQQKGWNVQEDHRIRVPAPASIMQQDRPITGNALQEIDENWSYHWDMQRIMADSLTFGDSGQALNGSKELPVKVIGVIGSGVNAERVEVRERLVGGVNFVPAGSTPSEKGDPADIRDRLGTGTEEVRQMVVADRKLDELSKYRVYRVYAEDGVTTISVLTRALLQAIRDHVKVIHLAPELSQSVLSGRNRTTEFMPVERAIELAKKDGIIIEE